MAFISLDGCVIYFNTIQVLKTLLLLYSIIIHFDLLVYLLFLYFFHSYVIDLPPGITFILPREYLLEFSLLKKSLRFSFSLKYFISPSFLRVFSVGCHLYSRNIKDISFTSGFLYFC